MRYEVIITVNIDEYLPDDLNYKIIDVDFGSVELALKTSDLLDYVNGIEDGQQFTEINADIDTDNFPIIKVDIETKEEVKDLDDFKYAIAEFCIDEFDFDNTFTMNIWGNTYTSAWNDVSQNPTERKVYIDDEENYRVKQYDKVEIRKK